MKKYLAKIAATAIAGCFMFAGAANAHFVSIGWKDNGNGTVSIFGEHWHGDQIFPCSEGVLCSDNGGLTISGDSTAGGFGVSPFTVQWDATLNNYHRDDMVTDGILTAYDTNTGNSGTFSDWLIAAPLVLGNGIWFFFTGTNCCIDQMSVPVQLTLTGITSVPPGTGPGPSIGVIPLPAALPLMATALGLLGFFGKRRRKS